MRVRVGVVLWFWQSERGRGMASALGKHAIRRDLVRLLPACFVVGAGMELFMQKTGFYRVVTRKEGERRSEKRLEELELRSQRDRHQQGLLDAFVTHADAPTSAKNADAVAAVKAAAAAPKAAAASALAAAAKP